MNPRDYDDNIGHLHVRSRRPYPRTSSRRRAPFRGFLYAYSTSLISDIQVPKFLFILHELSYLSPALSTCLPICPLRFPSPQSTFIDRSLILRILVTKARSHQHLSHGHQLSTYLIHQKRSPSSARVVSFREIVPANTIPLMFLLEGEIEGGLEIYP